ncbi:MAG: aspartate aminotransferase family protein [Bacteroidota bacterium]|nr:aspartate aminotransferase family protein [Bacteroidota bacterium]
MISQRQLFLNHVGQTSEAPVAIEVEKAEGVFIYDTSGKQYMDMISGVSVSNLGHRHPKIVEAVKSQTDKYMHLMVYGEYIQSPQVEFANLLNSLLPKPLNSVYFVNSGSEANEGALKLAKRYTGRHEIVAFKNAYHGSTHGALSIMSDEYFSQAYRPLLPGVHFLDYNNRSQLSAINEKTACVVLEVIQAEGGIIPGEKEFIKAVRNRCNQTGALLIIDEVQTGFMRTGKLFGFMHYDITPDIFTIAKSMGGGMPIGGLVASKKIMDAFKTNPVLGHITTFGGHPVSAAAALASLKLIKELSEQEINRKAELIRNLLSDIPEIKTIRGKGLLLFVEPDVGCSIQTFVKEAALNGLLTDWFLFDESGFRVAPSLLITESEIYTMIEIIKETIKSLHNKSF